MTNGLELWGGVECTVNRVGNRYFNQIERNGHAHRIEDLDSIASTGIRALRYPVLWELTAPFGPGRANWAWSDARLERIRELGIRPIVGLVHHGSGPMHTSLLDRGFATGLARFAGTVAERYPWVQDYTPVNEPLTTARFSGLYGVWYPHRNDERSFKDCLLNECRATVLAMAAIRAVNPAARLVQTDDLGKTFSTRELAYQAQWNNEVRWLGWDLLCGRVDRHHPMWDWLTGTCGATEAELGWFVEHPCPPDIIGINHYITSERWLDEALSHYPPRTHGGNGRQRFADIEAPRALEIPTCGLRSLLVEAWMRYRLPVAITEAHIDATREDQLRWLVEVWQAAEAARATGADVRAITVWALLGLHDWNGLVTEDRGYYECGAFDTRAPRPRPTAIASLMRTLASGEMPTHPVLGGVGWWRRCDRFLCPPVMPPDQVFAPRAEPCAESAPILVTGARGTLGRAFAAACRTRGLDHVLLDRRELDIAEPRSIERAIERHAPWAVINAAGFVRVDDAEDEAVRCLRENTEGVRALAAACARHDLPLVTMSSDLVFDGRQRVPYVERDVPAPLNVYGRSKAQAERIAAALHPRTLVVRTSAFFGPDDDYNFVTQSLRALAAGERVEAAEDAIVSPTYVPDLVRAVLDLLVDGESGIWHLANEGALSWHALSLRAARLAGIDAGTLAGVASPLPAWRARRPAYSVLGSERGSIMPPLDDALRRYVEAARARIDAAAWSPAGRAGTGAEDRQSRSSRA